MVCCTASGEVFSPPTTSTSGMIWGGFNGRPMTQRSGCSQTDCITVMVRPDELDAMIEAGGVNLSISENSLILSSLWSGVLSCTKSASATACPKSVANQRCSGDAFGEKPRVASACYDVST